jgi:hypothetical protein
MLDLVRGGGAQPKQGSTRSMSAAAEEPTSVAGQRGGTVCAVGSQGPELQRGATTSQRALTVEIDGPGGAKATTSFPPNMAKIAWPANLTTPGTYRVRAANQAPFEVTLKPVPATAGVAQVRTLAAAGCERQAADVLRAITR